MPKKKSPIQREIKIDGVRKQYSHYIWFSNTGYWPVNGEVIHHIDNNHENDEFNNLKLMTNSEHVRLHNKRLGKWEKAILEKLSDTNSSLQHRYLRNIIPENHPNRNVIFSQTIRRLKDKGLVTIEWVAYDWPFFLSTKEDFQEHRGIGEYEEVSKNKVYPSSWFPKGRKPVARASERISALDHVIVIRTEHKPDFVKCICLTNTGQEVFVEHIDKEM